MSDQFSEVYTTLRDIMLAAAPSMVVAVDNPGDMLLNATWAEKANNKPSYFGHIRIKKAYVAYHVMPLYYFPQLEDAVTEGLAKRRQGKTCFNFKKADDALFADLRLLTERAAALDPEMKSLLG